jgi:hypothetical protein
MSTIEARHIPWRLIGWGTAAALLALPFVAMQLQAPGVYWTLSDFIIFAVMIALVGIPMEIIARSSSSWSYRGGAALALLSAFLTVWANLAVGIVGSENYPPNQLFFAALLVGVIGSAVARLRPKGMSIAMVATAAGLWAAFIVASLGKTDEPYVRHLVEFIGTSVFAGLFVASALLFRRSAAQSSSSS